MTGGVVLTLLSGPSGTMAKLKDFIATFNCTLGSLRLAFGHELVTKCQQFDTYFWWFGFEGNQSNEV